MAEGEYEFWQDPIRENPQYKKWTWKIGKIQDIMSTPCNPSYEIWFYAFWHDFPKLVFSLTKPDTVDTYITRFGAGHKKNRKKRRIKRQVRMGHIQSPRNGPKGRMVHDGCRRNIRLLHQLDLHRVPMGRLR
jgi:hypothetical protein